MVHSLLVDNNIQEDMVLVIYYPVDNSSWLGKDHSHLRSRLQLCYGTSLVGKEFVAGHMSQ